MKYLFTSDLHIGDGSKADDFGFNDANYLEWAWNQKPDKIVLVGDIFERWQFKMKDIREAHPGLCLELLTSDYKYIIGNHDYSLFGSMSMSITTEDGTRILVTHGFQNDKMMTSPWSRLAVWIIGKLEKLGFKDLDDPDNWPKWAKKKRKSKIQKNVEKYVRSFIGQYDVVVTGHDHKLKKILYVTSKGKILHADCGTCQGERLEGIMIDTEKNKIKIVRS